MQLDEERTGGMDVVENREKDSLIQTDNRNIYWKLFWITLTLSASTFGGGFVIISMMKKKFVEQLHWISNEEMLDMTAIAQSSPGALGVNIAVVVGYRLKKLPGALVCVAGAILPPFVIISIISVFYNEFKDNPYIAIALKVMRAGVAAVIFDVVLDLVQNIIKTKSILWIFMMIAAFFAACFLKVSAIVIIFVCALTGLLWVFLKERREENR